MLGCTDEAEEEACSKCGDGEASVPLVRHGHEFEAEEEEDHAVADGAATEVRTASLEAMTS